MLLRILFCNGFTTIVVFMLYSRNYYIADSFMNPGIYFGGDGTVNES